MDSTVSSHPGSVQELTPTGSSQASSAGDQTPLSSDARGGQTASGMGYDSVALRVAGASSMLSQSTANVIDQFAKKLENLHLDEAQVKQLIDGVSQMGETLKGGKDAVEGFIGAFGGTCDKGRVVVAKGKALADVTSTKPIKDRGKELGEAVKALIKDKVIKKGAIIGGVATVITVMVAVLCAAATYPFLRAAIKNGTAAGNRKSGGTQGAPPIVYTLPPAYGSAAKSGNNSQYSQIG